jgi:hypothetical protein
LRGCAKGNWHLASVTSAAKGYRSPGSGWRAPAQGRKPMPQWVTNGPIGTGSSASSCLRDHEAAAPSDAPLPDAAAKIHRTSLALTRERRDSRRKPGSSGRRSGVGACSICWMLRELMSCRFVYRRQVVANRSSTSPRIRPLKMTDGCTGSC